jgi:hypothetical protein
MGRAGTHTGEERSRYRVLLLSLLLLSNDCVHAPHSHHPLPGYRCARAGPEGYGKAWGTLVRLHDCVYVCESVCGCGYGCESVCESVYRCVYVCVYVCVRIGVWCKFLCTCAPL